MALTPGSRPESPAALWAGRIALVAGCAFTVLGLGLMVLYGFNGSSLPAFLWGVLLLVVYAFFEPDSVRAVLGQGKLQAGSRMLMQAVLVIGAVILLNIVVKGRLGDKQLDLSKNSANTLSGQTVQVLKSLDQPVNATVWYAQNPAEVDTSYQLLRRYHDVSSRLVVSRASLVSDPSTARSQNVNAVGAVVFQYPGRPPESTTDATEQGFTSTLIKLSSTSKPKVYFLAGHGEGSLDAADNSGYSTIKAELDRQQITSATLNLSVGGPGGTGTLPTLGASPSPIAVPAPSPSAASPEASPAPGASPAVPSPAASPGASPRPGGSPAPSPAPSIDTGGLAVPKDADVVAIVDPRSPLSAHEIGALKVYLQGGGHVLASMSPFSPANLNDLVSSYGVKFGGGIVLDSSLMFRQAQQPITLSITHYGTSPLTRGLEGLPSVLDYLTVIDGQAASGYTLTPIVQTSNQSCERTDAKDLRATCQSADKKGPLTVFATLEQTGAKVGSRPARLALIGGASFAANFLAGPSIGPENSTLFVNTINWLALRDKIISIPPKQITPDSVFMSAAQQKLVLYGYVLFLPLLIGAMGVWVYLRNR